MATSVLPFARFPFALTDRAIRFGYSQFDVVRRLEIFIREDDPRPVAVQIAERDSDGFRPISDFTPETAPLAIGLCASGEKIEVYHDQFSRIISKDGHAVATRVDPEI